jgi:MerR family transcriptional regulator, thiopeptide resistance regulator
MDEIDDTLSIGELAAAGGTTRRALRHYDEIGLLVPAHRTRSGYRRYTPQDARRLGRIQTLAALGLPLRTILAVLAGDDRGELLKAVMRRGTQAEAELSECQRRRENLRQAAVSLEQGGDDAFEITLDALREASLNSVIQTTIPIFAYHDLELVHDHLVEVFGLRPGAMARDTTGNAVHAEVSAPDGSVIWLHRHAPEHGLISPAELPAATGAVTVLVDDVDEHYRRAVDAGAHIDYRPADQDYGLREYGACDPEGGRWYFAHRTDRGGR